MEENGDWQEYRRLVISELDRLDKAIQDSTDRLTTKIDNLTEEVQKTSRAITAMKARSATIGFITGLLASILAAVVGFFQIK